MRNRFFSLLAVAALAVIPACSGADETDESVQADTTPVVDVDSQVTTTTTETDVDTIEGDAPDTVPGDTADTLTTNP